MSTLYSLRHPVRSLFACFLIWKGFLLAIALGGAVASDYDTSTSLFFERMYGANGTVPLVAMRLTRWDAIYYMHSSLKGYVYEQEWAFGAGLTGIIRTAWQVLKRGSEYDNYAIEPVDGIVTAHVCHWIAVLALHRLALTVSNDAKLAYLAAALHIVSPAGLFLSAPNCESPFACLTFVGTLVFALGVKQGHGPGLGRDVGMVLAGVLFGVASVFRSNGITYGLLFAAEAATCLGRLVSRRSLLALLALVAPVVGGLCVACGTLWPQYAAWSRYCGQGSPGRPWCQNKVPSIYSFVQDHYWNVGFLRYWTFAQVPLFLLASPMLTILVMSGVELLRRPRRVVAGHRDAGSVQKLAVLIQSLAVMQTVVAILAISNYHVQIITRLAAAYPAWYLWIASCLLDKRRQGKALGIVMFMVMYAGIQGGLYAAFLPPA